MRLPIPIAKALAELDQNWQPTLIEWGDFTFRLVRFQGEFEWHAHAGDKVIFVQEGEMWIDFKEKESVLIRQGECYVAPKNSLHKPRSDNPCAILIIENRHL